MLSQRRASRPIEPALSSWQPQLTVRLRLTLSYTGFLVFAGLVVLADVYLVLRYGPDYPLGPAIPPREGALPASKEMALLRVSVLILVSLAMIGLAGGWILAGRLLRPLQAITAAARFAAATGSLDHRIELPGRPDEFTELADTFDAMLDRLQQSFEEQQRFAANASHELRTPHAVTKTMLEVAIADPDGQDVRELARRLHETNQRGIDIVETLLALSALGHGEVERRRLDLALVVDDALDTLVLEAAAAGVTVEEDLTSCAIDGNEVLLHQLVMNLGQNGIRHNLPENGTLRIAVCPDPSDAESCLLVVENTGAILDPSMSARSPSHSSEGRAALPLPAVAGPVTASGSRSSPRPSRCTPERSSCGRIRPAA
jgi:two-component system sensor histidine kinase VanS